jgi:hypothetical protein
MLLHPNRAKRRPSLFENKKAAIETVTPMLDRDGRWWVSLATSSSEAQTPGVFDNQEGTVLADGDSA